MGMGREYKEIKLAEEHGTHILMAAIIRRHAATSSMTADELQEFIDENVDQLDNAIGDAIENFLDNKQADENDDDELTDFEQFPGGDAHHVDEYPVDREATPEEQRGWQQQDLMDQYRFER